MKFRNLSTLSKVKISEQKVKVGNFQINFVKSKLDDDKVAEKTLLMMPGALGKKFDFNHF